MTPGQGERLLSGRSLALALAAIGLLAFVLPPVLARQIQARRVARATAQVRDVARALAHAGIERVSARPELTDIGVLHGPGDPPTGAHDRTWITARTAALQSYLDLAPATVTSDPWLRALQINIGAVRSGGHLFVLSAGPNGIIDTSFAAAPSAGPGGDDVLAPLP